MEYSLEKRSKVLEEVLAMKVESAVLNEISLCEDDEIEIQPVPPKVGANASTANPNNNGNNNNNNTFSNLTNDKSLILEYKWGGGGVGGVIHINKSDLDRLAPGELLNDNVILFYCKWFVNEMMEEGKRTNCYIFNTYFYVKFFSSLNNMLISELKEKDFQTGYNAVKKWTKNIDIFEKDFVVLPIHDEIQKHWCLFIIVYPNLLYKLSKQIKYYI